MLKPDAKLVEPEDLATALELLAENKGKARLIAGGTDIVVDMKNFDEHPELLISLANGPGLAEIKAVGDDLFVGALATPNAIARSDLIQERLPALVDAARCMGSYQIRNLATVGGNLCSASPSADLPPALIAAGAELMIHGRSGERRIPLRSFFRDVRKTSLDPYEILTHVIIPKQPPHSGVSYQPFKLRDANALAVASSAARLTLDDSGKIGDAVVALGAVAPVPMLAEKSMKMLVGKDPGEGLFDEAARRASEEAKPITDVRGTKEHRRSLVRVLTRRALDEALTRARRNGVR
jgi:carbon-monoxide dehydrogenase medium subunit